MFSPTAAEVGEEIDRLQQRVQICYNEVEAIRIRPGQFSTSHIYQALHNPEPEGTENQVDNQIPKHKTTDSKDKTSENPNRNEQGSSQTESLPAPKPSSQNALLRSRKNNNESQNNFRVPQTEKGSTNRILP